MKRLFASLVLIAGHFLSGCHSGEAEQSVSDSSNDSASRYSPKEYVELKHPEWTKSATLYEVNLRQYTPEGTFIAFAAHLPRLKDLGVDIIWLMPIHPVGQKNRKGTLGSYYSVKDYYGVNPEFGTMDDFKALVKKIHDLDMHVIIDWVANHSAWDNHLSTEHPDWYTKGAADGFQSTPWRDYDDIIDFDYSQPGLRRYMTDALKFWVKETGVDGYRCDVASFVPVDFWEGARKELDAIKPVFLLAEAADRDLHKRAFDATYAWSLWDNLHAIAKEKKAVNGLTEGYIAEHVSIWPRNAYRMNFVDNHDKNAWEGTAQENFGAALPAAVVLTVTMEGMPLIYSGQEAGLNRALKFFEKDPIQWREDSIGQLYKKLFALKHRNEALWNGSHGGAMERIKNNKMGQVIAFARTKGGEAVEEKRTTEVVQKRDTQRRSVVITVVNYSATPVEVRLESLRHQGLYRDVFSNKEETWSERQALRLPAWGWKVVER